MGNLFGKSPNIESQCKDIGYKKSELVDKYTSEKSKNYYKKKSDLTSKTKEILQSKLLITDLIFNNIFLKAVNSDIYSDVFKQTFMNILSFIDKKPPTLNTQYITLLVHLIDLKVLNSVTINKNSTRYKNTFTINDILTIYRYRLAISIYRSSGNRKNYISKQLLKDIDRSYYYTFVDNNNKFLYLNSYFKDHNFSKNPLTSESICNINLKLDNKSDLYKIINNNNSYDTRILDLIPESKINKNNNDKKFSGNLSNEYKIKENNNDKKFSGNLSNEHKINLKILLLQDFLNSIIIDIIETYFDCSYSTGLTGKSNKDGRYYGKHIYTCTGNSLIIYMCLFKCGIQPTDILQSGTTDPNFERRKHGKNYVINIHLITGHMTLIQHDIETGINR